MAARVAAVLLVCAPLHITVSAQNPTNSVVPRGFESTPGAGAQEPFQNVQRSLYLYDQSELIEAMPQGGVISAIAFRPDEASQGSLRAVIPSVEIRMSTSPNPLNHPHDRFSDFVGSDVTAVFPRGQLTLDATGSPRPLESFSYLINLPRPFTYDPRRGPLSLDILTYDDPSGVRVQFDGTSGLSTYALGGSISSDVVLASASTAPILQLFFSPIPEPSVAAILLVGILIVPLKKYLL